MHSRALECLYLFLLPNTPVGHDFNHTTTKQIITRSKFQVVNINKKVNETIDKQTFEDNMS